MSLSLTINGDHLTSTADPVTPLVDVLREEFHLTGAKPVCREGFCGACMVLLDGNPAPSCLMPVALAEGCEIRTVEGLAVDGGSDADPGRARGHATRSNAACAFPAWW